MDGMWSHDVASVIQVFGSTLTVGGNDPCDLVFVSDKEVVELDHGIMVKTLPLGSFEGTAELVCIPGFVSPASIDERLEHNQRPLTDQRASVRDATPTERLGSESRAWLCGQRATGASFVTLGTGVYALAVSGLLAGVQCTTHWVFASELQRLFPEARVDASRLLAFDERARLRSSAGGASGVDACLAALVDLAGHAAASSVAKAMNLWSPRSLNTRQDVLGMAGTPQAERARQNVEQVVDLIRRHLDQPWSVAQMAWQAGMSPRSFQRHFCAAMGETPARWVMGQRLLVAAQLLEESDLPLPVVASRVGISDADRLCKCFRAAYGETPSSYRKRLQARSEPRAAHVTKAGARNP